MASIIAREGQKPAQPARPAARIAAWLEAERRQAWLFAPVALGAGIALWFLLPFNAERQAALLAALALALAGLAATGTARRLLLAAGLLCALGLVAADLRSAAVAAPRLHHRLSAAQIAGEVRAVQPQAGGTRAAVRLGLPATPTDPPRDVRLSMPGPLPAWLAPGAHIRVEATLGPVPGPAIPGAHDPARRAWFEGISATGRALGPPELAAAPASGTGWFARLRQSLGATIANRLPGDAGAIALALTVGEQGRIRPPLLEAMRTAGLAHILTVSGFHIAVVVAGALFLFRRLLALWPWLALHASVPRLAAILAGLAGTGYTLLSGADLPAVRALIAAWVLLLALMLGRDPLAPRLVALAAFLILLARPEALLNPGFQLSFAAVAALFALGRSAPGRWLAARPDAGFLPRLARLALALVASGIVAELVLTPIALAHFGRAGAYGVLANIAAIPLTSFVIMPLLALWLLLLPFGLDGLVGWALAPALRALGGIGLAVSDWPGATLAFPAMPQAALALLAAGALLFILLETRLRLAGLPLVAAGLALAVLSPRPNLFISADGRQVGVVHGGALHLLRGHRDGFTVRNWAEQAATPASAALKDLPGARCNALACRLPLEGGLVLLAFRLPPPPTHSVAAACAGADIVTAPAGLPRACAPRWRALDPPRLVSSGAIAIDSRARTLTSVAGRAGDQPWSPAAPPGMRPRLLGAPQWTGVMTQ